MRLLKTLLFLVAIFFLEKGLAADSLRLRLKPLIGPPELLLPPPVDTVQLKISSVKERLQKILIEQADLQKRRNALRLNTLLLKTQTAVKPDADSIGTLEELMEGYVKSGDLKGQVLIYNTYGVYYGRFGQTEKAIFYFLEALKLEEHLKNEAGIYGINQNLCALYKVAGLYNRAMPLAQRLLSQDLEQKKTFSAANRCVDIAQMKLSQRRYKESESYILKKAFPLYRKIGSKYGRMNCFQALAELYFEQARYSEAKWFYLQSQIMAAKLLDNQAMIRSLTGLGRTKQAVGESLAALEDYRHAEELALRNNYLGSLIEINAGLSEIYNQKKDYVAADAALQQYTKFRESWIMANQF